MTVQGRVEKGYPMFAPMAKGVEGCLETHDRGGDNGTMNLKSRHPILVSCCLLLLGNGCSDSGLKVDKDPVRRAGGRLVSQEVLESMSRVAGNRIYVPVYAHVTHWKNEIFALTSTLSIRNTDEKAGIVVLRATYYDTRGKVVREYTPDPVRIGPLATLEYVVKAGDGRDGGSGANFIVEWVSDTPVSQPLVGCIMVGTHNQQGISLSSEGTVLPHSR